MLLLVLFVVEFVDCRKSCVVHNGIGGKPGYPRGKFFPLKFDTDHGFLFKNNLDVYMDNDREFHIQYGGKTVSMEGFIKKIRYDYYITSSYAVRGRNNEFVVYVCERCAKKALEKQENKEMTLNGMGRKLRRESKQFTEENMLPLDQVDSTVFGDKKVTRKKYVDFDYLKISKSQRLKIFGMFESHCFVDIVKVLNGANEAVDWKHGYPWKMKLNENGEREFCENGRGQNCYVIMECWVKGKLEKEKRIYYSQWDDEMEDLIKLREKDRRVNSMIDLRETMIGFLSHSKPSERLTALGLWEMPNMGYDTKLQYGKIVASWLVGFKNFVCAEYRKLVYICLIGYDEKYSHIQRFETKAF